MTVLSARYANPNNDAVVVFIEGRGDVLVSQQADIDAVDAWVAAGGVIGDYQAPPPSRADVDAEARHRTQSGFMFNGKHYQFDDLAKSRITGAAALAHQAVTLGGKAPTDVRWHDGPSDFAWIATDNSLTVMDAKTVLAFGAAAANWENRHVFAAKVLKDMDPIPADFTDDAHWPA